MLLKRKFPRVGLWPLLISVQAVELLWVIFSYLGIERAVITPDAVHLSFLPYSHSIITGLLLAALAWGMGKSARRSTLGIAIALGILSHIALDIIHHEPDIALLPLAWGPRIGLNLQGYPILDFVVELAFCIACWKIFEGSRALLIGIVIFNVLDIPLMFPPAGSLTPLMNHPNILPTLILIDVVATWVLIWWFGKDRIILEEPVSGIRTMSIGEQL